MSEVFEKNKYIFSIKPKIKLKTKDDEGRRKKVTTLLNECDNYNLNFNNMAKKILTYDKRNFILNISSFLVRNNELYDAFVKNKELPFKEIVQNARININFLKDLRDYICFYTLILANPNYKNIQEYLSIEFNSNRHKNIKLVTYNKENYNKKLAKGIVICYYGKNVIVLTSIGEIISLNFKRDSYLGQEIEGIKKKYLRDYKKQIMILCSVLVIILSTFLYLNFSQKRMIVIKGTSEIKLYVNKLNRIIEGTSQTSKGKTLLNSLDISYKKMDDGMRDIIEYMKNQKMLQNNNITIFVEENKILDNEIIDTEKYLLTNKIYTLINNCGEEKKLQKDLLKDEEKGKESDNDKK